MNRLLCTAEQSRALDQGIIERQDISGFALMARAAEEACQLIHEKYPSARRVVVYAGTGNNAGDGYLVACRIKDLGKSARVVQLAPAEALKGDARTAFEEALEAGIPMRPFPDAGEIDEDLVVDALLGTGLSRPVQGDWVEAVNQINQSGAIVVSLDVPSGLHADTGTADPHTVRANRTVTFITRKRGVYTADGPDYAGRVTFSDLNVVPSDSSLSGSVRRVELRDWAEVRQSFPSRRRNSHKQDYGHVLVIGGRAGFQGAAELCGAGALRCGSGLVSLAQPSNAMGMRSPMPELMCHEISNPHGLRHLAETASVIAIGPGLGQDTWAQDMLGVALEMPCSRVIDADALRLLAIDPRKNSTGNWVLTPHPGEAAALLNTTVAEIQKDRFSAVGRIQETYGGIVVLKGCGTLVTDAAGNIGVCAEGHPGMATAGMGDVLTGVIASLIGQGLDVDDAALSGACLHAAAGERARAQGMHGMVASDLLPQLRALSDPPDAL